MQELGLKDYVSFDLRLRGEEGLIFYIAARGMFRERCFRVGLQGVQLGHRGGGGSQANQAWRPTKKRIADDRGNNGRPIEGMKC